MTNLSQQTLAEIVTNDHRTATVLEKYSLDFCCKGKRTLTDACTEKGLDVDNILAELQPVLEMPAQKHLPFTEMSAEQLVSFIVTHHHYYVKQIMPQLLMHLQKVAVKHGNRFPFMIEVFNLFARVQEEMSLHMQKEERILFPAIIKAEQAFINGENAGMACSVIGGAVMVMEKEHDEAGELMAAIRQLTDSYQPPADACNTFRLSLAELKGFEEDLHRHVHLENHILFPMAATFCK
ncbi:MAG: iron-sulfur cluster repair di-iron protein [Chitinophagaceae bacterium]